MDDNVRRNYPVLLAMKRKKGHEARKGLLIHSVVR